MTKILKLTIQWFSNMKLNKFFYIILIAASTFISGLCPIINVSAQAVDPVDGTLLNISLVNPAQGQIVLSSSLTFTGKAPSGVIVSITLQDEDYQRIFQVHEVNLITNGTTTSDRNGDWVYVPSKSLVPGRYSVIASFQTDSSGSISTDKVFFTVADDTGATAWFGIPGITLIIIILIVVVALVIVIFRMMSTRKRKMFLHTTLGDIPVREVIDENNNVEIVPIAEPMLNLGQPMSAMQMSVQPVAAPTILPTQPYIQQPALNILPQQAVMTPVALPQQVQPVQPVQPAVPVQTILPAQPVQAPQPIPVQPQIQQVVPEQPQPTAAVVDQQPSAVQTPSPTPVQTLPPIPTEALPPAQEPTSVPQQQAPMHPLQQPQVEDLNLQNNNSNNTIVTNTDNVST